MPRPLHERLRELIPQRVKDVVPEAVKDRLRPPAWEKPSTGLSTPPDWARGERGQLKFVWGDPAVVWSEDASLGFGTIATEDAKGYPLPEPVTLPQGTEGTIAAVGPDFVVLQVGEAGYRISKDHVLNQKPEVERRISRWLEVTVSDIGG